MLNTRRFSLLLLVVLLTACGQAVTPTAYPTYDPFAPVSANNNPSAQGQSIYSPATRVPNGPTPTRAPLSVALPSQNSASFAPTPDAPHALPTARNVQEQYIVQPGDTLGTIAQGYGLSLQTLLDANGLTADSVLSVGQVLNIPPVSIDAAAGSAFKIIPDSELVFSPAAIQFDVDAFLANYNGYLNAYTQEVNGEYLTGAQVVKLIARNYSVNPRILLALLEYRSGWLTNPTPANVDYPLGNYDYFRTGLYRQLAWAADNLNRGYYLWRANALAALPLGDGTYVPMDPTVNAGTAGVQYFFSKGNDRATWDYDTGELGLFQTYNQLFGYPFDYDIASLMPINLLQPPMRLPFADGDTWSFTGGPHGGWDSGSAWAALDFAPPGVAGGCAASPFWVTAVADGLIVRSEDGAVMQDLDNDGYEQTGWNVLYMHIDSGERVAVGTYVYAGERIGHPSCEGGVSNATHLHLARKYNGEWVAADGPLPFNLDGWVSKGDGVEYFGSLFRNGVQLTAEEGVLEGVNQISR